ncbi:hypothetical protein CC1G_04920 [Coprinopsis cinerea okayama7|uniref:MYND-type domain-containing protein n=1 Tax=Coprinopsis cinerea (strain Okayama-7 / 130 / ATCC MYA-4618 / FGSC 9003) TaxID=240176 RepID=A8PFJ5_COPC7|nr:hypothetical protein CC1G_04920 [Coprinopsis cinerea okayama7\|eukprot:XP_001841076.2 hypothetical protein CC1G_04920 [Coprinopsis cinerea okayama7\
MSRLLDDWPTSPEQSLKAMDAFLVSLQTKKNSDVESNDQPGPAVRLVLEGLDIVLEELTTPPFDSQLSDLIQSHLEPILTAMRLWLLNQTDTPLKERFSATIFQLYDMIALSDNLELALLSSPCGSQMVALALTHDSGLDPPSKTPNPEDWDKWLIAVANVLGGAVSHKASDQVLSRVYSLPQTKLDNFIANVESFILRVTRFAESAATDKAESVWFIYRTVHFVLATLAHDTRFVRLLAPKRYTTKFFKASAIVRRNIRLDDHATNDLHRYMSDAVHWILEHRSEGLCLMIDLLENGILVEISEILATGVDIPEALDVALDRIPQYLISRRVQNLVSGFIDSLSPTMASRLKHPGFRYFSWLTGYKFLLDIHGRLSVDKTTTKSVLCFNPMHGKRATSTDPVPKACRGCLVVGYCSAECQREDWQLIHRFECDGLKRQKESMKDYWPSYRIGCQLFAALEYPLQEWDQRRRANAGLFPSIDKTRVYTYHGWSGIFCEPLTIEEYRAASTKRRPWSPRRFDTLVTKMQARDDIQLVAFHDTYGGMELYLLCLVKTKQSGSPARFFPGMFQTSERCDCFPFNRINFLLLTKVYKKVLWAVL